MREERDGGGEDGGQCGSCGYYLKNIVKFLISHIGLVSLVIGYCIVGAFTFERLEAEHELTVKARMSTKRLNVTDALWNITKHGEPVLNETQWSRAVRKRLIEYEKELIKALNQEGWDGEEKMEKVQWTFAGALFYSIILITTIGYGHIAPKTNWGKIVTILYAIPGVPLMMLCLANIGDGMAHSFRFLYWKVCCYACTKRPKKRRRGRSARSSRRYPSTSGGIRTRASSLRRSKRASEKSADSRDSAFYTSSYSDPDYKIDDDMGEADMRTLGSPHRSDHARASQNSRGSDYLAPPTAKEDDGGRVAVLYNKYALDQEGLNPQQQEQQDPAGRQAGKDAPDRMEREREGRGSTRRVRREREEEPDLPVTHQPRGSGHGSYRGAHPLGPGYRDSPPPTPRSPRVPERYQRHLSPPHHPQAPLPPDPRSRLSRLDEEYFYDDYDDYDEYDEEDEDAMMEERPVPIWLGVMLVVAYILGGATLFAGWETWTFLEAVYFCFITLTTIGFGDYVPAQRMEQNAELSIALCSIYLLFGIALLAMSFNLVQEEVISNVKSMARRLGILKDEEEGEMD